MIRKEVIPDLSTKILNLCLKENENGICDNMRFSPNDFKEEKKNNNNVVELFYDDILPITMRKLLLCRQYSCG